MSINASVNPEEANRDMRLCIVVPVFNEASVIPEFYRRLTSVLNELPVATETIYVDDGSKDGSLDQLIALCATDSNMSVIELSRNFGKEIAVTAGLDHCQADAAIIIDADLQDPPELITELVDRWLNGGADVVYTKRSKRIGESWLKLTSANYFYRILDWFSPVHLPHNAGDFRLLNRRALDSLGTMREQHRYLKGMFSWIGFNQVEVPYERDARYAGRSKWNYWRLWNFALDGVTSFSTAPLKLATYIGLFVSAIAFMYATVVIYKTLVFGEPVKGYPSLMVVILFLGGVQLASLGVIGEYLGRMFDETKGRPLYFVRSVASSNSDPANTPARNNPSNLVNARDSELGE